MRFTHVLWVVRTNGINRCCPFIPFAAQRQNFEPLRAQIIDRRLINNRRKIGVGSCRE
jgi:hypothetical protein